MQPSLDHAHERSRPRQTSFGQPAVLIEFVFLLPGKAAARVAHDACGDVVCTLHRYSELAAKCSQDWITYARSRPRETSFGQPAVLIEFVFLLPGKAADPASGGGCRGRARILPG